jgi:Mg-chelatase subunit ChlD
MCADAGLKHAGERRRQVSVAIAMTLLIVVGVCGCSPGDLSTSDPNGAADVATLDGYPFDIILAIDQSGSMSSSFGGLLPSDPDRVRLSASRYIVESLADLSRQEPYIRAGIVAFGSRPVTAAPIVPVTNATNDEGLAMLQQTLASMSTQGLGETDFSKAVLQAANLFDQAGTATAHRRGAVILFTDGEPSDGRLLGMDAYFDEIRQSVASALTSKDVQLYVVGVDATGRMFKRTTARWASIVGQDRVFEIASMDTLRATFLAISQKLLYVPQTAPDVVSSGQAVSFDLPPYVERVRFDVFSPSADLKLRIVNPSQVVAIDQEAGVTSGVQVQQRAGYVSYSITKPAPGTWSYELVRGTGRVTVYRVLVLGKIQLSAPSADMALGRRSTVSAVCLGQDGKNVVELAQYPLRLVARVTGPGSYARDFSFERNADGAYVSAEEFVPSVAGRYVWLLEMRGAGVDVTAQASLAASVPVDVTSRPYVVVTVPAAGKSRVLAETMPLEVEIRQAGTALDTSKVFVDDPNVLVVAQTTRNPSGTASSTAKWMSPVAGTVSRFTLPDLPGPFTRPGTYTVSVTLNGRLTSGGSIRDTVLWPVTVRESFWQSVSLARHWYCYLFFVVALLIGSVLAYRFNAGKPTLTGTLYIRTTRPGLEPSVEAVELSGRRMTVPLKDVGSLRVTPAKPSTATDIDEDGAASIMVAMPDAGASHGTVLLRESDGFQILLETHAVTIEVKYAQSVDLSDNQSES